MNAFQIFIFIPVFIVLVFVFVKFYFVSFSFFLLVSFVFLWSSLFCTHWRIAHTAYRTPHTAYHIWLTNIIIIYKYVHRKAKWNDYIINGDNIWVFVITIGDFVQIFFKNQIQVDDTIDLSLNNCSHSASTPQVLNKAKKGLISTTNPSIHNLSHAKFGIITKKKKKKCSRSNREYCKGSNVRKFQNARDYMLRHLNVVVFCFALQWS